MMEGSLTSDELPEQFQGTAPGASSSSGVFTETGPFFRGQTAGKLDLLKNLARHSPDRWPLVACQAQVLQSACGARHFLRGSIREVNGVEGFSGVGDGQPLSLITTLKRTGVRSFQVRRLHSSSWVSGELMRVSQKFGQAKTSGWTRSLG